MDEPAPCAVETVKGEEASGMTFDAVDGKEGIGAAEEDILRLSAPKKPGQSLGEDEGRAGAGDLFGGDREKKGDVIFEESASSEEE